MRACDWVYDDEPTWVRTRHGPIASFPFNVEVNDIPLMNVQHHESAYWAERAADTLECFLEEGVERPKILALVMHPYLSGVPHRVRYIRELLEQALRRPGVAAWDGRRIYAWFAAASDPGR